MLNVPPSPPRFDIAAVRSTLRSGAASPEWLSAWLAASYAEPAAFVTALRAHGSLRHGGIKGSTDGRVDLYNDCVTAHLGQGKRALVAREKGRDVEVSYDAIHARCGALSTAWRERGAKPGQCVCIVLPLGGDYVVALLTALRLGLIVCALPPSQPTLTRNRLQALAPDAVVIADEALAVLGTLELATLPARGGREPDSAGSYGYAADEAVLRLFSPFGASGLEPLDLSAGPLHAGLLRDALLVFALRAGDTLAMPGFDVSTCQPTALLTTLLGGAAWAELSPRALLNDPEALERQGVTVLGVTRGLRDHLLTLGAWPRGSMRAWFRAMTDPLDLPQWDRLAKMAAAAGVSGFNLVQSAAAGGVILFGAPFREGPGLHVWPPPGQTFRLSEVAADDLPALNGEGVYHQLLDDEIVPGAPRMFLTEAPAGYLCVGSLDVGPSAMTYPVDEVSRLVEQQPGVEYASVVVTAGSVVNAAHVALLVFVEASVANSPSISPVSKADLSALIAREIGEAFVPLRIEVAPLRPRVTEGIADSAWCRSQFLSGALRAKARREIFLLLSRLAYLLDVPDAKSSSEAG